MILHRVHLYGRTKGYVAYPGDVVLNQWRHIAVVFDGTTVKGYYGGVLQSDSGVQSTWAPREPASGVLMAGRYYTGGCTYMC